MATACFGKLYPESIIDVKEHSCIAIIRLRPSEITGDTGFTNVEIQIQTQIRCGIISFSYR